MNLRRMLPPLLAPLLATLALIASGCEEDTGTPPGTLRFGQIGEIRLHLTSALASSSLSLPGELQQALTWNSTGPWQLTETISYNGRLGDENTQRSLTPAEVLALDYAIWITQVNDLQTLSLFDPDLVAPGGNPECGRAATKLTLMIRDTALGQDKQWVRCVEGTLATLTPQGAFPGIGAARVANAALLMREYVFPPPLGFSSSYHGSFPFGTLARGEDTPAPLPTPGMITNFDSWTQFWIAHTGSVAGLPPVDFEKEVVLYASIGPRFESGETLEIRRVLPFGEGTLVEIVHSVPGNFCSPVQRTHRPFHVVVAPLLPAPITFKAVIREEVPCG
jgi:hypothetical protein